MPDYSSHCFLVSAFPLREKCPTIAVTYLFFLFQLTISLWMVHFSYNSYNLTISQFLNFLQFLAYEVVFLCHLRNSTGPKSIFGSVRLFFRKNFFTEGSHLQFLDFFGQNGFWKIPNGPPFQFFWHCETFFWKKIPWKGPQFTSSLTFWSPFGIFEP